MKRTETVADASLQASRHLQDLQEVVDRRIDAFERLLADIGTAMTLEELEVHESDVERQLATLRAETDTVLDTFEDSLERAEEAAVLAAIEAQLAVLGAAEDEEPGEKLEPADTAAEDTAPPVPSQPHPGPSDLVVRLRSFLGRAAQQPPTLEETKQKLVLARTVLQELRAQTYTDCATDPVETGQRLVDQREIQDLTPLVEELTLLVTTLEGGASPAAAPWAKRTSPPSTTPEKEPPAQPARQPLTPETVALYEEDYYRHLGLYRSLLTTASSEAHFAELRDFKKLLDHRRDELSQWRREGGYLGQTPLFFADSYEGALPGESHVRGVGARRGRNTAVGQPEARRRYTSEEVSQILRDFTNPGRPSRGGGKPGRKGNFNGRIFLTTGQINPRANKRRGDW